MNPRCLFLYLPIQFVFLKNIFHVSLQQSYVFLYPPKIYAKFSFNNCLTPFLLTLSSVSLLGLFLLIVIFPDMGHAFLSFCTLNHFWLDASTVDVILLGPVYLYTSLNIAELCSWEPLHSLEIARSFQGWLLSFVRQDQNGCEYRAKFAPLWRDRHPEY